jgi:hypothetical protein
LDGKPCASYTDFVKSYIVGSHPGNKYTGRSHRKNSADSLWSSSLDWFFEGSEWQETRVSQPVRETPVGGPCCSGLLLLLFVALFNVFIGSRRLQRTARVLRLDRLIIHKDKGNTYIWHIGTEGACPPGNTYDRCSTVARLFRLGLAGVDTDQSTF